jgi:hypothetical protein
VLGSWIRWNAGTTFPQSGRPPHDWNGEASVRQSAGLPLRQTADAIERQINEAPARLTAWPTFNREGAPA